MSFTAGSKSNTHAEAFAVISYQDFPTTSIKLSCSIGRKEYSGRAKAGGYLRLGTLPSDDSGSSFGRRRH